MLWLTMREVTKYTMKFWRNSDLTSVEAYKDRAVIETARFL